MLIDDEEEITAVLKIGLHREGYDVVTYSDPLRAVEEFLPNEYSLVICDMRMPGMDGLEVSKKLLEKDKNIEICMLSAFDFTDPEVQDRVAALPIRAVMKKPVSLSELTSQIDAVLHARAARQGS